MTESRRISEDVFVRCMIPSDTMTGYQMHIPCYVVLLSLLVLALAGCSVDGRGLYSQISSSMAMEAEQVGIELDMEDISYAASRDNLIITSPIARTSPGFTESGPFAFTRFSLASMSCGNLVNGSYVLSIAEHNELPPLGQSGQGSSDITVQFKDHEGEVVEELLFTRQVMRMPAGEAHANESLPRSEVIIRETMPETGVSSRIVIQHYKTHYIMGDWEIWEWLLGGT